MQGRENKMSGFSGDKGSFDRFQIAHFADENDIGVLTKAAAQCFGKIARIDIDLALRDE